MPAHWSETEIYAIVADYFEMLRLELAGRRYNKTEHRLALMDSIERSKGSIERKHMNISAVLTELGLPCIDGYKPFRNYQQALFEAVEARLHGDPNLYAALAGEILTGEKRVAVRETSPRFPVESEQIAQLYEDPPMPRDVPDPPLPEDVSRIIRRFEPPAERDARNRILGKAGEQFVFDLERQRLSMLGRDDLANQVCWVARDEGDGAGYDIRSFRGIGTGEEADQERLLEIKTTNGPKTTPFFITRNELRVSKKESEIFRVVRLYDFQRRARAYRLAPPLEDRVRLCPAIYSAYP